MSGGKSRFPRNAARSATQRTSAAAPGAGRRTARHAPATASRCAGHGARPRGSRPRTHGRRPTGPPTGSSGSRPDPPVRSPSRTANTTRRGTHLEVAQCRDDGIPSGALQAQRDQGLQQRTDPAAVVSEAFTYLSRAGGTGTARAGRPRRQQSPCRGAIVRVRQGGILRRYGQRARHLECPAMPPPAMSSSRATSRAA